MTRSLAALLLSLLLAGCAHPTLSGEQAQSRVKQGAFLLDVRSPGEFAEGHLAGAVNVPVQELEATLSSLPVDRNREIVVYCRSGMRSSRARAILLKAGYSKVEDLGGMSNWK
jgi:phage shock protein E